MHGTTDEIKARLNIVELVSSYVRLEKSGSHWKARCPFHQERSPSFMVNEERNMWHCFGCGKGGDVFAFVMEIERLYEMLELATKFYEHQLGAAVGQNIQKYLTERGLSAASLERFRLGYAPAGWRHLLEFLEKKGYSPSEMEMAGLVIKKKEGGRESYYDRFRDRIMFPIFDILGRTIGYSARVAPGGDETQAKYINTPETPIYHKSRALYGLFQAKLAMKQAGVTVVVEGNTDVIALHQAGIENTVAVSGTALTAEQLGIIKRYSTEVRLFFDMDGAGQKAARASTLLALDSDLVVTLIGLSSGKDAAEMGKDNLEELKRSVAHAVPAPEYFLKKFLAASDRETAAGKRKIVEEFTEILVAVRNPVERSHFIRMAAEALNVEEKTVSEVVSTAFLHRERREGPALRENAPTPFLRTTKIFHTRAERLSEELIALLYAHPGVRRGLWTELEASPAALGFLEKHPLFFFIRQAGGDRDPLDLIEESALKSQATKLIFHSLEAPALKEMAEDEREVALLATGREYLAALHTQVTQKERMRELEQALREARAKKDKGLEQKLLQEFVEISRTSPLPEP